MWTPDYDPTIGEGEKGEGGRAHAGFIVVLVVDCKVTVLRLEQLAYKCVYVHVCAYACVRMCIYACPYLSVQ